MVLIVTIAVIWLAVQAYNFYSEAKAKREIKSLSAEAKKQKEITNLMREEFRQSQIKAQEEHKRLVAVEVEQIKQAKELAKHDKKIAELEFRVTQAESDIEHWKEQYMNLTALLDIELAEQAGAVPGSKSDIQHQKRIIALTNQIHSAESKLAKAQHIKETAAAEISA